MGLDLCPPGTTEKSAGLVSSRYDIKGLEFCPKRRIENNWTRLLQIRKKRRPRSSMRTEQGWNCILQIKKRMAGLLSSRYDRKDLDLWTCALQIG
jgi:hypothetical protein